MARSGLLAAVTALIAAALPAAPATAGYPGANGRLVVVVRAGGHSQIATVAPDGSARWQLTHDTVDDTDPGWSPDGRLIAFVRATRPAAGGTAGADLYVMHADGSHVHRLTRGGATVSSPTWSPDGRRIAYARDGQIWVIGVGGAGARPLLVKKAAVLSAPAWSPDGHAIAFAGTRPGFGSYEIWVMHADGTGARMLTHTPNTDEQSPNWSPDGSRIAYARYGSSWRVLVMAADGSDPKLVGNDYALSPAWSADGSRLAFYDCANSCGVVTSLPGGGDLTRVLAGATGPDWQARP